MNCDELLPSLGGIPLVRDLGQMRPRPVGATLPDPVAAELLVAGHLRMASLSLSSYRQVLFYRATLWKLFSECTL